MKGRASCPQSSFGDTLSLSGLKIHELVEAYGETVQVDNVAYSHEYTRHIAFAVGGVVAESQSLPLATEGDLVMRHATWHPGTVD